MASPLIALERSDRSVHTTQHSAGHDESHTATSVEAVKVSLISEGELRRLLEARHLEAEEVEVDLKADTSGLSALVKLIGLFVVLALIGGFLLKAGVFAKMSLSGKLYAGFASILILTLILGISGYSFLATVSDEAHLEVAALDLDMMVGEAGTNQNGFVLYGIGDAKRGEALVADQKELITEYYTDFDAIRALNVDGDDREALDRMEKAAKAYEKSFLAMVEAYHEIEQLKEELDESAEHANEVLEKIIHEHEEELHEAEAAAQVDVQLVKTLTELVERLFECEVANLKLAHEEVEFLVDKRPERIPEMEKQLGLFYGTLNAVEGIVKRMNITAADRAGDLKRFAELRGGVEAYEKMLTKVIRDEYRVAANLAECEADLVVIETVAAALSHKYEELSNHAKEEANSASIILMVVAMVVGALLAFFLGRSISLPLNRAIDGIRTGSDQVTSASGQISASSQSLAEGSTEQAASLEETSSALEEMASMTRQNAENAGNANTMMSETGKQVAEGATAVKNMATAMGEISGSSDEISKIIKTIEEIAFQTNLLALNAAVEAARAGDAGKGFAVVADEVRNLAQRSAEAARNTAELIEGTVSRVKNGTEIVGDLETSFAAVEESSSKVAGLVAEITAASNEQAQGVDQVNTAVAQMDKVTQQNAANAEESASASEELNAQADQLNSIVNELAAMVSGTNRAKTGQGYSDPSPVRVAPPIQPKAPAAKQRQIPSGRNPDEVIPMDDEDDFKDF
ncbi:MAG: methyl-accepting chemotaxis protein [Planctomycetota bacterium]|jgi:methyl-accepting chemotaxis protein